MAGDTTGGTRPGLRVLFITCHYPPDPAVGAVRAGRVVDALLDAGHTVDVITVRLPGERGPDQPHVRRVIRLPNAREIALGVRNGLRRLRPGRARSDEASGDGGYVTPTAVPQWKRFLVAMALMPDDEQGFILPALLASIRRVLRGVDVIYTSGPPHSAHLVGLVLRKVTRRNWIAEFRDPWTDNQDRPRYTSSETAFAIKRWLERSCLASADRIITVTESVARLFRDKLPPGGPPVSAVRNGIEPLSAGRTVPRREGTRIVYLGSLYNHRDPRPLLRALAELERDGQITRPPLRIDFFGDCRWFHDVDVAREAARLGIGDRVHIHRAVPRSEATRLALEADLLVLFAQEQPLQVPQKLYEYFATGNPILAFADRDGETAAMLERIGGHFVIDAESGTVRETVRRALEAAGTPALVTDPDALNEWSVRTQMEHLVRIVENGSARTAGLRRGRSAS